MSRTITEIIETKDHYETLGIDKSASSEEITNSYKRLARQYHPDRCNLEHAEDAFKKIGTAYEAIKTPEKRRQYDLSLAEPQYRYVENTDNYDPTEQIFRSMFARQAGFSGNNFYYASTPFGTFTSFSSGAAPRYNRRQPQQEPQNSTARAIFIVILAFVFFFAQIAISSFNSPLEYSDIREEPFTHPVQVHYLNFHDEYFIREKDVRSFRVSRTSDDFLTQRLQEISNDCKVLRNNEIRLLRAIKRDKATVQDYLKLDFTLCEQVGLGGATYTPQQIKDLYSKK